MTLRNNPHNIGVVVWSVERGKAAEAVWPAPPSARRPLPAVAAVAAAVPAVPAVAAKLAPAMASPPASPAEAADGVLPRQAGIMVGDVVLSISSHLVDSIDNLVAYVGECSGTVHMEVAGSAASRLISMVKSKENPKVSQSPQQSAATVAVIVVAVTVGNGRRHSGRHSGCNARSSPGRIVGPLKLPPTRCLVRWASGCRLPRAGSASSSPRSTTTAPRPSRSSRRCRRLDTTLSILPAINPRERTRLWQAFGSASARTVPVHDAACLLPPHPSAVSLARVHVACPVHVAGRFDSLD